jgi:hypothetical protein
MHLLFVSNGHARFIARNGAGAEPESSTPGLFPPELLQSSDPLTPLKRRIFEFSFAGELRAWLCSGGIYSPNSHATVTRSAFAMAATS